MMRHMCGNEDVGFYSAALSITGLTGLIFTAIITAFQPAVLEAKKQSDLKFESSMVQLNGIIAYLALAQCIVLTIAAKPVVNILYGREYIQAIPILQIAVWYTIPSYLGGVRSLWTLAENKQRYIWSISFAGMILNILLNLILIPMWQGLGAAAATLVTQIFTNVVMVYLLKPMRKSLTYIVKGLNLRSLLASFR